MSKLTVTELDFESIKSSLKGYLESQDTFQDYDFEGSGLSVLLNVMAYNTHYMGMYAHMLYNESFLDSAVKRGSVVSLAKHLNYTPDSIRAAQAIVDVTITANDTPTDITIPQYTQFRGSYDGTNYTFVNIEEATATPTGVGNTYKASSVTLVQGKKRRIAYVVNTADTDQKYILPFANIDTSLLKVTVQEEESDSTSNVYTYADTILDIDGDSLVYFLQETDTGRFELKFGDGVLGKALENGNVILVDYIITDGATTNKTNTFTASDSIQGYTDINLTTVQEAAGGARAETISQIKHLAPRFYESQKRAVTENDYKSVLLNNTSIIEQNFDSISVWGGEDNDPPKYGNVFISLKPKDGVTVTNFMKNQILEEILDSLNIIGIIPEIVDPEYLYLEFVTTVNYAKNRTNLSRVEIANNVKEVIKNYRDNTLSFFDTNFRYSKLSGLIDDSDPAILNNLMTIILKRVVDLTFNVTTQYTVKFHNALEAGTILTSNFFINESGNSSTDIYYMADDEEGNIVLYRKLLDGSIITANGSFGTVDYNTGEIVITSFTPINLVGSDEFTITASPASNDINTVRNLILTYNDADIEVTATGIIE